MQYLSEFKTSTLSEKNLLTYSLGFSSPLMNPIDTSAFGKQQDILAIPSFHESMEFDRRTF